jgi:hypothetical protein
MSQVDNTLFLSTVQTLLFLLLAFYGIFFLYFFDYYILLYKLTINISLKLLKLNFFILKAIKNYSKNGNLKNL